MIVTAYVDMDHLAEVVCLLSPLQLPLTPSHTQISEGSSSMQYI